MEDIDNTKCPNDCGYLDYEIDDLSLCVLGLEPNNTDCQYDNIKKREKNE